MSAFGAAELAGRGGVICPEHFLEARLEDVIALRADVFHSLVVEYCDPDSNSNYDGQTDGDEGPPDTLKNSEHKRADLDDLGNDAYDDYSPAHTVKLLFVFHLNCYIT